MWRCDSRYEEESGEEEFEGEGYPLGYDMWRGEWAESEHQVPQTPIPDGPPAVPTVLDRKFYLELAKKLGLELISLRRKNKYLNKKIVKYFNYKPVSVIY